MVVPKVQSCNPLSHVNEIQKLIRLYRANECLWNPKTSGFYNMALNKNAWLRISCFFNNRFTVDQLKLQILSLRYYFAQEQVALKQSQLGGYHYEPRHSYFEELQFLKAPMSNSANLKAIETDNKINYLAVDIFPPNSSENSIHSEKVDFQLPSALIQTVDILEINRESELPQPPLELKAQPNELRAASGNDSYHATADNQTRSPYSARHRRSSSHSRNSDNERCKYNQQQLQYMNTVSTGQRVSSHPLKKVLTGRYRCQPRRSNAEDWHSNNDVSSRKVPNRMSDVRQNDAYEYNPYLGNFREIVRKKSGNDAKKPLENYNSTEPHYLLRKEAVHQDGQRANQNPLSPIQFEKQLPRNIDSSYYPEDQDNPPTIKQEPHNLSNGRQTPPTVNRQRGSLEKKSRTDLKEAAAVVSENAFTQTPDDDPSLGTNEINSPDDRSRLNKASENSPLVRSRAQKMQQMSNELLERLQIKRRRNEDNFRERPEKKLISEEDNPDGRLRPVDEEPQERYLGKSDVQPDPFLSYQNESKEFSANQPLSAQSNSINAPSSSYQGRYSYDRDYYHDKDQAEIQAQRSNDGYTSAYNDKYRFNRQDPKMIERCRCEDKYIDQEKRGQKDWQNYPNYVERRRKYADGRGTIRERYAEQDPSYGRGIREEIIRDYSQRTCSPQSSKVNLRAIGKYNERRETLYNLGGEHRIHGCQANEQENYTRRTQYYNLDSRDTVVTKNQIDQEHYKRNEMEKMSKIHCQKYLEKTAYVKANEGKHYNVEEKMQDCTCSTDEEELETVKVKKSISRCDVAVETDIDMSLTDRQKKPMCDCSDESFSVSMNNGKKTNSNEKPKAAKYVKRVGKICACKPALLVKNQKAKSTDPPGTTVWKADPLRNRVAPSTGTKPRGLRRQQNKLEEEVVNKFQALVGRPLRFVPKENLNDGNQTSQIINCDGIQSAENRPMNPLGRTQDAYDKSFLNRSTKWESRADYSQRSQGISTSNPFPNLNFNASKGNVIVIHPPVQNFRASKYSCNMSHVDLDDYRMSADRFPLHTQNNPKRSTKN
ncbi:uncharacterized protein LOC116805060 isoform X2 [Drosophila grimshawi]|uniref:uncharacterized protein LOC116805060 isoform X2 n=1 Tax=Drosophila grimshawi TaxID=7222 RepID=UPI000C86F6F0|nr:uncharacterized protein LOC116805060 isoform X2 [Drosophila grimshawi]